MLEPHKLVFRKVPGTAGRDAVGALKQAGAKIGVRCAPCNVAISTHQPQTDGDVGNGIMSDLLECRIQQAVEIIHGTTSRNTCGGA